jgi:isoquinoline 1-oxidoreductase beta subunit
MSTIMNRREFLGTTVVSTAAAGALVLGFPTGAAAQGQAPEVNAWVVVQPDDKVIIRIARSEMGQGTLTGLAQMVAEELECDWARVSTEYPTPGQNLARKRVWGNYSTGGSRGIRESQDYVRKGGAAARMMLVQAAANEWKVPVSECSVAAGVISHAGSGRRTTYGKLATAAGQLSAPSNVVLKDPKDWKLVGKRLARLDTVDKTNGKQIYGTDLQLPRMLNASIRACPVFGGQVRSFEPAQVMGMPGVKKVIKVGSDAVAVVADTWWRANKAVNALTIDWDLGPNASVQQSAINASLTAGLDAEQAVVGNRPWPAQRAGWKPSTATRTRTTPPWSR